MSVTVEFAFNAEGDLQQIREMVNDAVGVRLQPYDNDENDLFCRFLGLELSLGLCDLVDDRDLDFSRFRFLLSTRTPVPDSDLRDYQIEATAIAANAILLRGSADAGMLTYEVQRLLARYTRLSGGGILDGVSRAPVCFPEHLVEIRSRALGPAARPDIDVEVRSFRRSVIDHVELVASAVAQLRYETEVPGADVPAELVSGFVDDLFHPKSELMLTAFTSEEMKSLAEFYGRLCVAADAFARESVRTVSDIHKISEWRSLMAFAKALAIHIEKGAG